MPRGKPFICWLSSEGHYRNVALYVGDEVEFDSSKEGWVRARIGCKGKSGLYVARWDNKEETVWMMTMLRPPCTASGTGPIRKAGK